jgi:hypothetical protein
MSYQRSSEQHFEQVQHKETGKPEIGHASYNWKDTGKEQPATGEKGHAWEGQGNEQIHQGPHVTPETAHTWSGEVREEFDQGESRNWQRVGNEPLDPGTGVTREPTRNQVGKGSDHIIETTATPSGEQHTQISGTAGGEPYSGTIQGHRESSGRSAIQQSGTQQQTGTTARDQVETPGQYGNTGTTGQQGTQQCGQTGTKQSGQQQTTGLTKEKHEEKTSEEKASYDKTKTKDASAR